jgi:hypothetical protein
MINAIDSFYSAFYLVVIYATLFGIIANQQASTVL